MSLGLVGRKVGMTRVFSNEGVSIPVTVLDVSDNRVTQIKTKEVDGYLAVQLTYGDKKANRVNKAQAGHFSKAGVKAGLNLVEFRVSEASLVNMKVSDTVSTDIFSVGQRVDVTGTSIGKGFAGAIKCHNFSSNRASHGNSRSHNTLGSIGQCQDPGRVFRGKRMPKRMGHVRRTIQNLEIIRVDGARQLLLVKGAVPGCKGSEVMVRPAVKAGV